MDRSQKRLVITIGLVVLVLIVIVVPQLVQTEPDERGPDRPTEPGQSAPDGGGAAGQGDDSPGEGEAPEPGSAGEDSPDDARDEPTPDAPDDPSLLEGLRAVAPDEPNVPVSETLGSLDPDRDRLQVELHPASGISRIVSAVHWQTALARQQAEQHYADVEAGKADPTPLPDDSERLVIQRQRPLHVGDGATIDIPVAGIHSVFFDATDQRVYMLRPDAWTLTAPGRFESLIVNADDEPVLRVVREFTLAEDDYRLTINQWVENLTDEPLGVHLVLYSPSDMPRDPSAYIDRRRFRIGYLLGPERDPERAAGVLADTKFMLERQDIISAAEDGTQHNIWPDPQAVEAGETYELSWFAITSRYFAMAFHPPYQPPEPLDLSLEPTIKQIYPTVDPVDEHIFVELVTGSRTIEPGGSASYDVGLFAGPLDRKMLATQEPYKSLNMSGLILYVMGTCCTICTFQWLAHLLINFLALLHDYVVFDWAVAIIVLVVVVRGLLHPITRKAQINMQKFGRAMSKLKPEIDKLQKRYKDDPKTLQQEQLRLMREHGVNPLHMLGCLPLLLQAPIWIALWAMLYFAYELWQAPAFYGVFQLFWDWAFLADLSSSDNFIKFAEPVRIWWFSLTGFNLLPLLLGVAFFLQQKYMTPPPTPNMSEDQIRQQKMMRVMMVVMMPIVLYAAPSGLTLYIMTSSFVGILEGRYIRRQIEHMDLDTPVVKKTTPKKKKQKKSKDPEARAYAEAMDARKEKQRRKKTKNYKKRK